MTSLRIVRRVKLIASVTLTIRTHAGTICELIATALPGILYSIRTADYSRVGSDIWRVACSRKKDIAVLGSLKSR